MIDKLTTQMRELLKLLQAANGGAVSVELIRYHLWERKGVRVPTSLHSQLSGIRSVTGLGIIPVKDQRVFYGYRLAPSLNAIWCKPENWCLQAYEEPVRTQSHQPEQPQCSLSSPSSPFPPWLLP